MPLRKKGIRLDFSVKNLEIIDEKKRVIGFDLVLDPERYERREIDGKQGWFDKLENVFFTDEVINDAFMKAVKKGLEIKAPPERITDLDRYFRSSVNRVKNTLQKEIKYESVIDMSDIFLSLHEGREMKFVVLYIDLVGSTELSRTLESTKWKKLISVFSQEMTFLITGFSGFVLKYAGDCVIGYFPAEWNLLGTTDIAVDCAVVMRSFIINVLNPILKSNNFPEIKFRIGIDSGESQIVTLGANKVKSNKDLLGYTMNIASKICASADQNQIAIGQSVYEWLHISRKKMFKKRDKLPNNWKYVDSASGSLYQQFILLDELAVGTRNTFSQPL